MQYRELGNSGIKASVIGFGAWAIGGWMWGGADERDALDAVAAAIDSGITLLDTAPIYGYGRSEELVGRAIQGRRDQVVLATKCGLSWSETPWPSGRGELHFYGDEKGRNDGPEKYYVYKYLRADAIVREVEHSLKLLQTDYIDLYQTHWQDGSTSIEETMTALMKLKEQGKIRAIGVSNASLDQIREYRKFGTIDVDQERFSLLDRNIEQPGCTASKQQMCAAAQTQLEQSCTDYCRENAISILAYSPMANGLLTGRMTPDRAFGDGDLRAGNPKFSPERITKVNAMLQQCSSIAEQHGVTVGQLVIAWTFGRYERMHVLCGARDADQVADNAKAGEAALSVDELTAIDRIAQESGVM